MMKFPSSLTPVALAATALLMPAQAALAQDAAATAKDAPMSLDRVVVTGTATGGSKMKQSVSISTMEADQIGNSGAASAAEILRSIPGVHSENSGGEGNANVTVRGVPISAGGSRYVQFQEDGLPVLLFGDISFGTPDQFLRADYNLDHLEVIRGGSASTLASNAPGGVVNFISKTGADAGGAVGVTLGLAGGSQRRLDFDYGGKLGAKTSFHIGGFNRVGEGDRPTDFNAANGGQIKGNITQQLDNGFIRLNFKALDDRTPTFLPVPVAVVNGQIQQIPGIDPRKAFFISPSFGPDNVFGPNGSMLTTNPKDGLHVSSTAFGAEAQFDLGSGWTVNDKFRKSSNSGRFIGMFPANNGDGATPATSTTFTGTLFNTSINDLGNTVNDLKLSKSFGDAASGKATVTAGLFSSVQNVALTWFWNQYTVDMKNTGAGNTLLHTGWDTWGGCCVRNFDVQYTNTSPYAALSYEVGGLTLDGSVRHDSQHANGYAESGDTTTRNSWNTAAQQKVDYKLSHTSYSLGANYALNKDLAGFARISDGVAFSADRLLYGNPLNGSVPVALNEVKQIEAGVKYRSGGLNVFATLFNAKTDESNYEATTQKFTANQYDAKGLELEMGYRMGDFRLSGGATLTRSRITASNDASTVGKKPRRLADVVLQVAPSYVLGSLEFGGSLMHNGKSYGDDANTITMPAYTVVNAFVNYQVNERTQVSLNINNLGNTLGYTEIEGDGHAARAINGRTAKIALKYSF
jgi:outer membrane receptor protein involved in Fe transport